MLIWCSHSNCNDSPPHATTHSRITVRRFNVGVFIKNHLTIQNTASKTANTSTCIGHLANAFNCFVSLLVYLLFKASKCIAFFGILFIHQLIESLLFNLSNLLMIFKMKQLMLISWSIADFS